MRLTKSKVGLTLSFLYLIVSIYLILSQGLFGESFIALILGFPWSFLIVLSGLHTLMDNTVFLYAWILIPIIMNVILFYWIGVGIQKLFFRKSSQHKEMFSNIKETNIILIALGIAGILVFGAFAVWSAKTHDGGATAEPAEFTNEIKRD